MLPVSIRFPGETSCQNQNSKMLPISRVFLIFAIAIFATAAVRAQGDLYGRDGVVQLTGANFAGLVLQSRLPWVVEFYAPCACFLFSFENCKRGSDLKIMARVRPLQAPGA